MVGALRREERGHGRRVRTRRGAVLAAARRVPRPRQRTRRRTRRRVWSRSELTRGHTAEWTAPESTARHTALLRGIL